MLEISLSRLTGHRAGVFALHGLADGSLLSGGADGLVVHWPLAGSDLGEVRAKVEGCILCLQYLPLSNHLLIGTLAGEVYWLDWAEARVLRRWQIHPKGVMGFCLTRGGRLASYGANGQLTWWDTARCAPAESWPMTGAGLRCMLEHPNLDQVFVLGASDAALYWLDCRGDFVPPPEVWPLAHKPSVFALCFAENKLWTGGRDAQIKYWEAEPQLPPPMLGLIPAHLLTVNDLCYLPEWGLLASAGRDRAIKIWAIGGLLPRLVKVLDAPKFGLHQFSVNRLCYLGSGLLASASDDANIGLWQFSSV